MKRAPSSFRVADVAAASWPRLPSGLAGLYQRWREPLVRKLHGRIGNHAEAEDTAQQVFLQMAASGHLPEAGKELAYLDRSSAHARIDAWRKRGGDRALDVVSAVDCADALDAVPANEASDPMNVAHHREQLARLDAAMAELPERQREAFALHAVHGLSQDEVAGRMGVSVRMVSKHISRALAYCELRLQYGSLEQMQRLRAEPVPRQPLADGGPQLGCDAGQRIGEGRGKGSGQDVGRDTAA